MEPASLIRKRRPGEISDYPICRRGPKNWVRNLRFELPQIAAPALLFACRRRVRSPSRPSELLELNFELGTHIQAARFGASRRSLGEVGRCIYQSNLLPIANQAITPQAP